MQKLQPVILLISLLSSWISQAQNNVSMVSTRGELINLTNSRAASSNATYSLNSLILDDVVGGNIFMVMNKNVLEQTNPANSNFSTTYTFANHSTANVKGAHITPVPGGACNEYYILYTLPVAINTTIPNTYDGYEIGAVKVTVDANLHPTYSTIPSIIIPESVNVVSQNIQAALSPESNGTRTYYVGLRRSASAAMNNYQIAEISVGSQGLSLNGGFYARSQHTTLETNTLEMSPNGQYLAWVGTPTTSSTPELMIKDVSTGITSSISVAGLGIETDVEFDETNKRIYVTSQQGIQVFDVANLNLINTIPNTSSSMYYGGDIEQVNSTYFLVTKSNGSIDVITNQAITTANLVNSGIYHLPEQIDGEPIQHQQANIPQVSISVQGGWLVGNATGGSGQYKYQWNQPGDPNYKRYYKLSPCGRYTHTLLVTDLVTGCTATASAYYAAMFACSAPLPIGPAFRKSTQNLSDNIIVKVYPNPASKTAQVQVPAQEQLMGVTIVNLQGKVVLSVKGNQRATQSIEVASLPKGLYILQIKTNHHTTQKRLAVK